MRINAEQYLRGPYPVDFMKAAHLVSVSMPESEVSESELELDTSTPSSPIASSYSSVNLCKILG